MIGQQMPAACRAEFAIAFFRLVIDADIVFPLGNFHGFGLPKAERSDRRSRPAPARAAMAEARRNDITRHG